MKPPGTYLSLILSTIICLSACKVNSVGPQLQPPPALDTSSHNFNWRFDTVGSYPAYFNDVWGTSPNNVYAVGFINAPTGQPSSYIEYFDGNTWRPMNDTALMFGLQAGGLNGIDGLSNNDFIVVGTCNGSQGISGFIGRWDGAHWRNVSPSGIRPLQTVCMLSDSNIFAAGDEGYVIHYDGVHWDSISSVTTLDIWRILAIPTGEVYGVASDYWNSPRGSVILRIDSSQITTEQVISGRSMFGIWGDSRSNIFIVGEGIFHKGSQGDWQELVIQRPPTTLFGIGAMKRSDVLIGGYLETMFHWNGVSWQFYDSLYNPTSSINIKQIRAIGDTYFCVGTSGSLAFALRGRRY